VTDCYWCVSDCEHDVCHCGVSIGFHTVGDGHSPVSMECACACECHARPQFTVWITRDEREIPLATMHQGHLENLFGHLEKRLTNRYRRERLKDLDALWSRAVSAELDRRRSVDTGTPTARSSTHDS
jgi:hypothetical protein